jgi:hypothetical protein
VPRSLLLSLLLLTACDPEAPVDDADATAHCEEIQSSDSACMGDEQLTECTDCYLECGGPCLVLESCPLQFSCG